VTALIHYSNKNIVLLFCYGYKSSSEFSGEDFVI